MRNPFIYGSRVRRPHFTNRTRELTELRALLAGGQNLWVHAPRRMGKSSLLIMAVEQLPDPIECFYVDLYGATDVSSLVELLAAGFLNPLVRRAQDALEVARRYLPTLASATVRLGEGAELKFEFTAARREPRAALREVLQIPRKVAESGERCVVVLDEFQQLLHLKEDWLEAEIRTELTSEERVAWVLMGSRHHLMAEALSDERRPLFNSCESYPVGPVPKDELAHFLVERFAAGGIALRADRATEIADLTSGKPAYSQQLASQVFQVAAVSGEPPESLDAGLEALIESQTYRYQNLWDGLTAIQQRVLRSLAIDGTDKPLAAARLNTLRLSVGSMQRSLKSLEVQGVVDRTTEGWEVADPFLPRWLRMVFDR